MHDKLLEKRVKPKICLISEHALISSLYAESIEAKTSQWCHQLPQSLKNEIDFLGTPIKNILTWPDP